MVELVYDFDAGFDDPSNKNAWFANLIGWEKAVLEVGCATGYVGEYLVRERNCSLVGIEIVPAAAEKAKARHCYDEVLVGDVQESNTTARLGDRRFDFVLFGDVLEHLADPVTALQSAGSLLTSSGRVLVCVPNIAHWSMRIRMLMGRFEYTETGILDRTHLRFYTPTTAAHMVQDAGMRIISSGGVVWLPSLLNRLPSSWLTRAKHLSTRVSPGFFYGQVLLELAPV